LSEAGEKEKINYILQVNFNSTIMVQENRFRSSRATLNVALSRRIHAVEYLCIRIST